MPSSRLRSRISADIDSIPFNLQPDARQVIAGVSDDDIDTLSSNLAKASSRQEAFALLGEEAGAGATGDDPSQEGENLFLRVKDELRKRVCQNAVVQAYCNRKSVTDGTTLGALILGALTGAQLYGLNVFVVTTIIVRIGINEFCGDLWIRK